MTPVVLGLVFLGGFVLGLVLADWMLWSLLKANTEYRQELERAGPAERRQDG